MKATIQSTNKLVNVEVNGELHTGRIWEVTNDRGVKSWALVFELKVDPDDTVQLTNLTLH